MLMPPFTLHHPSNVEQACEIAKQLIEDGQHFDWVAVGTDLIPKYKLHINTCLISTTDAADDLTCVCRVCCS